MKIITKVSALVLAGCFTSVFAQTQTTSSATYNKKAQQKIMTRTMQRTQTRTSTSQPSVDQQIKTIENAPLKERFKLMNQFKVRLQNMNQQDRTKAIAALKSRMQTQQKSRQNVQEYPQNIQQTQQSMQTIRTNTQQSLNQQQAVRQWNNAGQPGQIQNGQNQTPMHIPMH